MFNYFTRTFAGAIIGFLFGATVGCALIVWSWTQQLASLHPENIPAFLAILAIQSAVVGGIAGLASGRSRGAEVIARTVPVGALVGLLLMELAVALMGWHTDANSGYIIAARSANHVASVNMVWGALIGLVVGLCFIPFFWHNSEPAETSQAESL